MILNASAKTIYSVLGAEGSFSKEKMSIFVEEVRGDNLVKPHFEYYVGSQKKQIQAAKAKLYVDRDSSELVLHVENAYIQIDDGMSAFFRDNEFKVPLGNVHKREGPGRSPSNLPLRDMETELHRQTEYLRSIRRRMAINAAFDMAGGNLMAVTDASWNQMQQDLETETYRKFRLETEPWRRWANGFSCLCFVIVGAPLAIRMRKSDFWTIFAVCFYSYLASVLPAPDVRCRAGQIGKHASLYCLAR